METSTTQCVCGMESRMKKIFRRNQIIITALAVMIAVAGYLNYAQKNVVPNKAGTTPSTSEKATKKGEEKETGKKSEEVLKEEKESSEPGEAVYTGVDVASYIADAKLTREQTRAKSKESLLEIVNSTAVTEEQRQQAVDKMMELTDMSEKEAEAESLLKAQGYEEVVVNVSQDDVSVVMDMTEVDDVERAQIEDAIKRATDYSADKIIITPLNEN